MVSKLTEKKMRKRLRAIWFHYERLADALRYAHDDHVIEYNNYGDESPCKVLFGELSERIHKTTEKQIASVIQSAVKRQL